jgi:glutamine amidotransferase
MTTRIAIVDIGCGNIGAVANMLKKVADGVRIAAAPEDVAGADKIVLPGVGAFDNVAQSFAASPLRAAVMEGITSGKPFLGICVGMQLLVEGSAEGREPGLGLLGGACERIPDGLPAPEGFPMRALPVPHMSWNEIRVVRPHALFHGLDDKARFYFVHSFHVRTADRTDVLAETDYGMPLTAVVGRDNVLGVQFHPEKSSTFGMRLLENFCRRV